MFRPPRSVMGGALALLIGGIASCSGSAAACRDLCTTLVQTCGYDAYPDVGSCMDGCRYAARQGALIDAQFGCVQNASCNTFAVLECEHAFGLD